MKKLFVMILALVCVTSISFAQKSKATKTKATAKVTVPQLVKDAYAANYPESTTAVWAKTSVGNYMVTQELENGEKQTIEYNGNGDIMNSRTLYKNDLVPEKVVAGIQAKYSGSIIEEANRVELPGIAPYYAVKIKLADGIKQKQLYVSEQGLVSL